MTLIRSASVDTMFVRHAKNYPDGEPRLPPPVHAPEIAAMMPGDEHALAAVWQTSRRDTPGNGGPHAAPWSIA